MKLTLLRIHVSLILMMSCIIASAQVVPADASRLNHTEIMFEYPEFAGAEQYHLYIKICEGERCEPLFDTLHQSQAVRIKDRLTFGKKYTWHYEALRKKKVMFTSPEFTFYTMTSVFIDPARQKAIVERSVKGNIGTGVIFLDGLRIAVNHAGKPVWFANVHENTILRDINLTPQGTVTYLTDARKEALETTLEGQVLWSAPHGAAPDSDEGEGTYHHEFTKLRSGNYIVAGKKQMRFREEGRPMKGLNTMSGKASDMIFEFDAERNIVWSFDLLYELKRQFDLQPDYATPTMKRLGHLNGITVDEQHNMVYASFKNFSNVLKIDKNNNRIVYMFGNKTINFADSMFHSGLFAQQHCPILLGNGNLVVFDNNTSVKGSGIVELNSSMEGQEENAGTEKVWELRFKDLHIDKPFTSLMGSVQELPNGHLLIGMGKENEVFEVSRKKEVLWRMSTFAYNEAKWLPMENYRVCWSSSLYPAYFTLQRNSDNDTISRKTITQKAFSFTINNEGTEDDLFDLELIQPGTGFSIVRKAVRVGQETSQKIVITAQEMLPVKEGTELLLTVHSQKGADTRQLRYLVKP